MMICVAGVLLVIGLLCVTPTSCSIGAERMKGELYTPGNGCAEPYKTLYSSLDESCYCNRDIFGDCSSLVWCTGSLDGDGTAHMACYDSDPKCGSDLMTNVTGALGVCYSSYSLHLVTIVSDREIAVLVLCGVVLLSVSICILVYSLKRTKDYKPMEAEIHQDL